MSSNEDDLTGRSVVREQKQRHYEGWDIALDDAIARWEAANPGENGEFTADLQLSIKFTRKSPGWVGEYRIGLHDVR